MGLDVDQTLARAISLIASGDAQAALSLLTEHQAATPSGQARLDIVSAELLLNSGAHDRAFDLVMSAEPEVADGTLLLNIAIRFYNIGRLKQAIQIYERLTARPDPVGATAENQRMQSILRSDEMLGGVREGMLRWSARVVEPHLVPRQRRRLQAREGRPLRVAFAGSFFNSPIYLAALVPVFRAFDWLRIQTSVYSLGSGEHIPPWAKGSVWSWTDLAVLDDSASAIIRAGRHDIIVDLDGIVGEFVMLFASRPAPITVSWYNVLSSIPAPVFDYLIVDPVVLPENERANWSERIVDMPATYFCMRPLEVRPSPGPAPYTRLRYPTVGSFNRPSKLGRDTIESWGRILQAVPSARLYLANSGYDAPGARERVLARLAECGVEAGRVDIHGSLIGDLFFKAYDNVDLALDPFPFNGGTTTFDALWQGVPVVGFPGDRLSARVTTSILKSAGLDELIAPTLERAEQLIIELLRDGPRLVALRQTVADRIRDCPFTDPLGFAHAMTENFETMFQERWAEQVAARPAPSGRDGERSFRL